jgi:hypothetical protein
VRKPIVSLLQRLTHILFLSGAKSGNEQFALDIATWTFQESLVLRIDSTTHHLINETAPREHYTINENIVRHSQPMN